MLAASKAIRDAQEPCTSHFEQWADGGCPTSPHGDEVDCLQSIGGLDSPFCRGTFECTALEHGWPTTKSDQSPLTVASAVVELLSNRPTDQVSTNIVLLLGGDTVRLHLGRDENVLTTTRHGWRRRGHPCRPSDEQVYVLLRSILTSTGRVDLPCAADSRAGAYVNVPRVIHIRLSRFDEWRREEWLGFTGQRS